MKDKGKKNEHIEQIDLALGWLAAPLKEALDRKRAAADPQDSHRARPGQEKAFQEAKLDWGALWIITSELWDYRKLLLKREAQRQSFAKEYIKRMNVLTITIQVKAPAGQAIGIKEDLAQHLERYGDARVVSITEDLPEQLRINS